MIVGIYGGSFNPVHFGHIGLAHWVLRHTDIDSLWFMVTPNNPLKDSAVLADGRLRLENARKAVADSLAEQPLPQGKSLQVSDFEFSLPLPSFTAQTLRALALQDGPDRGLPQLLHHFFHLILLIKQKTLPSPCSGTKAKLPRYHPRSA